MIDSRRIKAEAPKSEFADNAFSDLPSDHVDQDDAWTVIRSYFSQHGLVS